MSRKYSSSVKLSWFALSFCLLITIIIIAVTPVLRWAEQEDDTLDKEWHGTILQDEDEYYNNEAEDICDIENHPEQDKYDGLCDTYRNMWTAGVVYLVFSSFTMFLMLVWIVILIASVWDKNCNGVGLIVAIVSWIFYLIGVLVWFLLTKAQFDEDECDEYDMDNGNPAPICAKQGSVVAIFSLLWLLLLVIVYGCILNNSKSTTSAIGDGIISQAPQDTPGDIEMPQYDGGN